MVVFGYSNITNMDYKLIKIIVKHYVKVTDWETLSNNITVLIKALPEDCHNSALKWLMGLAEPFAKDASLILVETDLDYFTYLCIDPEDVKIDFFNEKVKCYVRFKRKSDNMSVKEYAEFSLLEWNSGPVQWNWLLLITPVYPVWFFSL